MKTTVDLSDQLLLRAKRHALEHRTTLKALVESGLQLVLSQAAPAEVQSYRFPVIRDALRGPMPVETDVNELIDMLRGERTGSLQP